MKAIFLDRDGVINVDHGYVGKVEEFHFIEGIFEALRKLQQKGYKLFIVTNQSGIGRGYYSEADFLKLTEWMLKELQKEGVEIEEVAYCPHHPDDGCGCRKPEPGMIDYLAKKYGIDLKSSWMIGDKPSDLEAGRRAGVGGTILLDEGSLLDVVDVIQ